MPKLEALTGNEAAATAFKQVNPDVAAVYPITPQTELMHQFCDFAADGEVDTEIILWNRAQRHERLRRCFRRRRARDDGHLGQRARVDVGSRLHRRVAQAADCHGRSQPRAQRPHQHSLRPQRHHGLPRFGWIQIYCENSQEAYDSVFQAFRIAEHPDVLLPTMITFDGFIISHTTEGVELLPDDKVKAFVGSYKPDRPLLDTEHPYTVGPLDLQNYYFEHKRQEIEAMANAMRVIPEIQREFGKMSGRSYASSKSTSCRMPMSRWWLSVDRRHGEGGDRRCARKGIKPAF